MGCAEGVSEEYAEEIVEVGGADMWKFCGVVAKGAGRYLMVI